MQLAHLFSHFCLQLYEIGNDDLLASELKRYDNMVMLLQAKYIRLVHNLVFCELNIIIFLADPHLACCFPV